MGNAVKWLGKSFGEFLDGFFGGILDWGIDFLDKIGTRLVNFVKTLLSIFDNIPKIVDSFNGILKGMLWFVPDAFWHTLYAGIAIIFLWMLYKYVCRK